MKVQKLKELVSPAEFYSRELSFMPRGTTWADGGLCPFHADNRVGSFRVNLETGAYKCFSCLAKGGDIVAFIMQRYSTDFSGAIKIIERYFL